jgi:hypothetical protein
MNTVSELKAVPLIVVPGYQMVRYLRAVVGKERERCGQCYRLRLEKAAQVAKERGFDAFTTTLFISPHQDHRLLSQIGRELAAHYGTAFLSDDLRAGFRESHRASRELGLYHQRYCGCIYSEWERYAKATMPPIRC